MLGIERAGPPNGEPQPEPTNRAKRKDQEETLWAELQFDYDPHSGRIQVEGKQPHLTRGERELLVFFCENADRLLKREQLLAHVWGEGYEQDYDLLHHLVHRLRPKLGRAAELIKSEPGTGYWFRRRKESD